MTIRFQYLESFLILNSSLLNWTHLVNQKNEANIICPMKEDSLLVTWQIQALSTQQIIATSHLLGLP